MDVIIDLDGCTTHALPQINPPTHPPTYARKHPQARELQQKYEKKMKMLRDDLELRRKQVRHLSACCAAVCDSTRLLNQQYLAAHIAVTDSQALFCEEIVILQHPGTQH